MNTLKAARLMRRLMLPFAVVLALWIYLSVGFLRVPMGMDTLPETHPEGSLCLIDKRSGAVQPGAVVFADVRGGTLLSRVVSRNNGFVVLQNDNSSSELPDSDELGPFPLGAVRGVVLAVFPPEPDGKDLPRGR